MCFLSSFYFRKADILTPIYCNLSFEAQQKQQQMQTVQHTPHSHKAEQERETEEYDDFDEFVPEIDVITNAWFGPEGTVSPLHHDPYHNLFAQVVGQKYWKLFDYSETPFLYPLASIC